MRGDAEGVFNRSIAAKSDISSRAGGNSTITSKEQNYVGFANFPNQVFRRAVKNGFEFTLMVVGQSGLGKSTFLNTLFLAEVATPRPPGQLPSTVKIDERTVRLMENGTLLTLTLVDTPGFGDQIDNSKCWEPINAFIDSKYLEYFSEETKIERKERVPDRCVHLCLYFIEPTGHCLKALDIELMKRLHERVNIIPVVAKADCLTQDEMKKFKAQVYQFPEPEDEDEKKQYDLLKTRLPFAIIGSNTMREEAGKRVRYRYIRLEKLVCREYPWGVVEVDNLNHNDFLALRDMVIRTNLIDLIGVTRAVHYENFRFRQMSRMPKDALDRDPFTQMEDEQRAKETELKQKKSQLDKLFDEKVAEKESKIDEREKKLSAREKELQRIIEDKKAAIERIRADVQDLRRGDSKSNLNAANENGQNPSPPGEKTKKKGSTLGLFTRN